MVGSYILVRDDIVVKDNRTFFEKFYKPCEASTTYRVKLEVDSALLRESDSDFYMPMQRDLHQLLRTARDSEEIFISVKDSRYDLKDQQELNMLLLDKDYRGVMLFLTRNRYFIHDLTITEGKSVVFVSTFKLKGNSNAYLRDVVNRFLRPDISLIEE